MLSGSSWTSCLSSCSQTHLSASPPPQGRHLLRPRPHNHKWGNLHAEPAILIVAHHTHTRLSSIIHGLCTLVRICSMHALTCWLSNPSHLQLSSCSYTQAHIVVCGWQSLQLVYGWVEVHTELDLGAQCCKKFPQADKPCWGCDGQIQRNAEGTHLRHGRFQPGCSQ